MRENKEKKERKKKEEENNEIGEERMFQVEVQQVSNILEGCFSYHFALKTACLAKI